jgi:isoquinoline 1-oxidoreductase beta subunit
MFEYDTRTPFGFQTHSEDERDEIKIQEITYLGLIDSLYAQEGNIYHDASQSEMTFGEAAFLIPEMESPPDVDSRLKDSSDFTIIGTRIGNADELRDVNGSTIFESDVILPDMHFAFVMHSPTLGVKIEVFDVTE